MTDIELMRYTFRYDHFRYFVRAVEAAPFDPKWDTEGVTSSFVFPPHDGVIGRRPPGCIEIMPGHEAGPLDVDVAWLDQEPVGVYDTDGVASACDILTPSGHVVLADHLNHVVAEHNFGDVSRCRVFVEVYERAWQVPWGTKSEEHHTILVWPTSNEQPWWRSAARDERALTFLDGYRRGGIDPEVGQRDP